MLDKCMLKKRSSKVIVFFLFILYFFIPLIVAGSPSSAPTSDLNQCSCNCNEYSVLISKLKQNITLLSSQLNYYRNLSDYYRSLYENVNISLSQRDILRIDRTLVILHQNISNVYHQVENLRNQFNTIFSLKIGLTFAVVLILERIIDFAIRKMNLSFFFLQKEEGRGEGEKKDEKTA